MKISRDAEDIIVCAMVLYLVFVVALALYVKNSIL